MVDDVRASFCKEIHFFDERQWFFFRVLSLCKRLFSGLDSILLVSRNLPEINCLLYFLEYFLLVDLMRDFVKGFAEVFPVIELHFRGVRAAYSPFYHLF